MVLAYHVIFGAYGFWLPNDPRGSWSDFVGAWELFRYGAATTTDARASVAGIPHDRATRLAAKEQLKYPAVSFTGIQARAIGTGFAALAEKSGITVWACAILPNHVHMVLGRHRYRTEQMVNLFKGRATKQLCTENRHPFQVYAKDGKLPTCWARGEWKVYLSSVEDIVRAIRYVENNPLKENKPRQTWKFVKPFTGV